MHGVFVACMKHNPCAMSGLKSNVFTAKTTETRSLSACKAMGNIPFCDGTHNN